MTTCACPENYYLKEGVVDITVNSAMYVADPIYVRSTGEWNDGFNLSCDADVIKAPIKHLHVELCGLQIHWEPDTTYKFRFYEDFYRDSESQPNPEFDIEYTTNPIPDFHSADPAFDGTDVTNNTTIRLNFDRMMCPGDIGNIYLYEVASPSDILLGTFSTDTDVTLSSDSTYISFSTLGLIKANTQYYILTDADLYRDYDNFYLPQITSSTFYTFTTDASTDAFPDLISIDFVTGGLEIDYIRYRATAGAFEDVTTEIVLDDKYRIRNAYPSMEDTAFTVPSVQTTYTLGNLSASMTASFDGYDIFTTYANGNLRSTLDNEFELIGRGGPLRDVATSMSASTDLTALNIRPRFFDSDVSSSFTQTSSIDYGILSSVRANGEYQTDTDSVISDGPFLLDTRGYPETSTPYWFNNPGETYTMAITPTSGAVTNIAVPTSVQLDKYTGLTNSKPLGGNRRYYVATISGGFGIFRGLDNSLVTSVSLSSSTPLALARMNENNDVAVKWDDSGTIKISVYDIDGTLKITKTSPGGQWGYDFDINNSLLFVGDPSYSTNKGIVRRYDITTGTEVLVGGYLLTGSSNGDYVGRMVRVSDNRAVVSQVYSGGGSFGFAYTLSGNSYTFNGTFYINAFSPQYGFETEPGMFDIYGDYVIGVEFATTNFNAQLIDLNDITNGTRVSFTKTKPTGWTSIDYTNLVLNDSYFIIPVANSSNNTQSEIWIFDKSTGTLEQTISASSIGRSILLEDNVIISVIQNGNQPGQMYPFAYTDSFASNTLTLNGGPMSLNLVMDNMTITPTTSYSSDFVITYQATRDSDSLQTTRQQDIDNV